MPAPIIVVPVVGYVVRFGGSPYTLTAVEPYQRDGDLPPSTLLHWRTDCRECGVCVEFATGAQFRPRPFCRDCVAAGGANAERNARRADERAVTSLPGPLTLRAAVAKLHPAQMSLAPNAPRRIHAPTMLREALPRELGAFTLAEIAQGLQQALAQGYIAWDRVGRRASDRSAVQGLWPRPDAGLRVLGLLPPEEPPNAFS